MNIFREQNVRNTLLTVDSFISILKNHTADEELNGIKVEVVSSTNNEESITNNDTINLNIVGNGTSQDHEQGTMKSNNSTTSITTLDSNIVVFFSSLLSENSNITSSSLLSGKRVHLNVVLNLNTYLL